MIRLAAIAIIATVWFWAMPEPVPSQYCEMVTIWHESDGEHGWPDYRNNYDQECEK